MIFFLTIVVRTLHAIIQTIVLLLTYRLRPHRCRRAGVWQRNLGSLVEQVGLLRWACH